MTVDGRELVFPDGSRLGLPDWVSVVFGPGTHPAVRLEYTSPDRRRRGLMVPADAPPVAARDAIKFLTRSHASTARSRR